jgi:translin
MANNLDAIGKSATEHLALKHAARERALPKARMAIRACANSIRATHRQEFETAKTLHAQAAALLNEMASDLHDHQDIYFAGFVQDAQKEYAEAVLFGALVQGHALATASELAVGWPAYLNGLAEAVGELRRYVLDQLRQGKFDRCEEFLSAMDDIYALLVTIDFPDAITGGLRRTTDATRGILEKTRGDLTAASGQAQLQHSLRTLQQTLERSMTPE